MSAIPPAVPWLGVDRPPADPIPLRAGPLTMVFEPDSAFLRYIRLGDREVLRGIYSAVRDEHWGTVSPVLSNLRLSRGSDGFDLSFDVECHEGPIDFRWRGSVTGSPDGSIVYTMEGTARTNFLRNRIGFCVLHPIAECAGHDCRVEAVDGALAHGVFPKLISPHQPFQNVRAIAHEVVPEVWAEVRMTGDVFEMEDQRNWSDASFKTYCTPLALPFPAHILAGTTINQTIQITLHGDAGATGVRPAGQARVLVQVSERPTVPLPKIGLTLAIHSQPLQATEVARLRALNLHHLRVDLDLTGDGWREALRRADAVARCIGVGLETALFLGSSPADELQAIALEVQALKPPLARWLIFHVDESATSTQWVELARQILARHGSRAPIGAGTHANFTELNRNRPADGLPDLICYSANPQVHAFDNRSLVETLPMHLDIVETARSFIGSLPIAVTPLTLRPSPNPASPQRGEGGISGGELPPSIDPRQGSLFAAGWTLGALKNLAQAEVDSVTCFETTGPRGVMETPAGSSAAELFRSIPGSVFPIYHVLADAGEWPGARVLPTTSSDPLAVECLALESGGRRRILVANLSSREQAVVVRGCQGAPRMKMLDDRSAEQAMVAPDEFRGTSGVPLCPLAGVVRLALQPFAVARIDFHATEN